MSQKQSLSRLRSLITIKCLMSEVFIRAQTNLARFKHLFEQTSIHSNEQTFECGSSDLNFYTKDNMWKGVQ